MNEIIKVYKQDLPNMKFIGKKYQDYSHWGEWFENGWFDVVEEAMGGVPAAREIWEDAGGYVGIEYYKDGVLQEYWIGMFAPIDTKVPEGFESKDFRDKKIGVCWIYGKEEYAHDTSKCPEAIKQNQMEFALDDDCIVSFENGLCPRFTTPDEKGNVILDYCYLVK